MTRPERRRHAEKRPAPPSALAREVVAWTEADVAALLVNPVYAGIGTSPVVSDEEYATSFLRLQEEHDVAVLLGRTWDAVVNSLHRHPSLPDRDAWIRVWTPHVDTEDGVFRLIASLRRMYGGRALAVA